MSCAVAVASSPVFSSSSSSSPRVSSSFLCKASSIPSSSTAETFDALASSSSFSSGFRSDGSPLLKRKRPSKLLHIPIVSLGLSVSPIPVFDGRSDLFDEKQRDEYALCCKKGRRGAMEDQYSAVLDIEGNRKHAFFGVFDGHGGAKAAEFASKNIVSNILDQIKTIGEEKSIEEAVKRGYLKTDSDFLKQNLPGGSCCVTTLIRDGNLVVSNAGDCRAVMSRGGLAEALTSDHRPSREDEKGRVQAHGGYVDLCRGVWRIQGSLGVSRGIGDRQLKQWVIAEPETKIIRIEPNSEFLILASDGLWDKVSNQEAVDIVRALCVGIDQMQPLISCKKLIDLSVSRGSTDDITVMIVPLGRYI